MHAVDTHHWKRAETNQAPETALNKCERWTRFRCERCPATFLHFFEFHMGPVVSRCEFRIHPVCEASTDVERDEAWKRLEQVQREADAGGTSKTTDDARQSKKKRRQSSRSRSRSRSASPKRTKRSSTESPQPPEGVDVDEEKTEDASFALCFPAPAELAVINAGRASALTRYIKHCLVNGAMKFNASSKACTLFLPSDGPLHPKLYPWVLTPSALLEAFGRYSWDREDAVAVKHNGAAWTAGWSVIVHKGAAKVASYQWDSEQNSLFGHMVEIELTPKDDEEKKKTAVEEEEEQAMLPQVVAEPTAAAAAGDQAAIEL
jgi:hypothetical protein